MQAALGLAAVLPATRARIFTGKDRRRAVGATNAGIVPVMQRVVRNLVNADIGPNILAFPSRQGVYFQKPELAIPFDQSCSGSRRGLITPDPGDPCLVIRQNPGQGLDLPQFATAVRITLP